MRFEGTLTSWNDERGFGFITPRVGGDAVFVHVNAFTRRDGRPQVGQLVSFEVEIGRQGKKRALRVEPALVVRGAVRRRQHSPARWGTATLFAIPAFLLLYLVVALLWHPPTWVGGIYLAASLATFMAYRLDKTASQRDGWRMSERTLHALALAGGWPEALLAQQMLRHKTTKAGFRVAFWGTVVVNVVVFVVLCSPVGRAVIASR